MADKTRDKLRVAESLSKKLKSATLAGVLDDLAMFCDPTTVNTFCDALPKLVENYELLMCAPAKMRS